MIKFSSSGLFTWSQTLLWWGGSLLEFNPWVHRVTLTESGENILAHSSACEAESGAGYSHYFSTPPALVHSLLSLNQRQHKTLQSTDTMRWKGRIMKWKQKCWMYSRPFPPPPLNHGDSKHRPAWQKKRRSDPCTHILAICGNCHNTPRPNYNIPA